MITFSTRPFTDDEKQTAIKKLPSFYKRFEEFALMFIGIMFILLFPLLAIDRRHTVSSKVQGISCIVVIIAALIAVNFIRKKYVTPITNKERITQLDNLNVEAIHVQTTRAIKREDFEDFGVAFYIDVLLDGKRKVLYLWGQYLDVLEYEGGFPNTKFEIIREKNNEEFIDFKIFGQYFKEEKTLPPFAKEIWEKGSYPLNGQLLDVTIDEIS